MKRPRHAGLLINQGISGISRPDALPSIPYKPLILHRPQKHVVSYHAQTKSPECVGANTWEPLPYECRLLSSIEQIRQQKPRAELQDLLFAWR